jgi:4'-phosphopantetheinyl transferase
MRCGWPVPEKVDELYAAQVDVWCAELDAPWLDPEKYQASLADPELARADAFHYEVDRRRFLLRRGILRQLIGVYLKSPPGIIQFETNPYGKLSLLIGTGDDLQFNMTISGDIALYAFTRRRLVGIDVERIRADFEVEAIARRFFSANEQYAFQGLPPEQRIEGFFNGWTRKEAFLKALGKGFWLPSDQFDVSLAPGEPAELQATHYAPEEARRWRLQHLEPVTGYAAALAVEGSDWRSACWRLDKRLF